MANIITLTRFPLLFFYLGLLYYGGSQARAWAVPLILFIILLDGVDGIVARRRNETSLLGSVLDIATDRTLEFVLWVIFADLDLIPVVVPIIVLTRGTSVDAVRAVGMRHGQAAFEQLSHPLSRFLVSSRTMRFLYGGVKAAAFAFLSLDWAVQLGSSPAKDLVHTTALALTWISVAVCLARGIPVLVEGYFTLQAEEA